MLASSTLYVVFFADLSQIPALERLVRFIRESGLSRILIRQGVAQSKTVLGASRPQRKVLYALAGERCGAEIVKGFLLP